MCLNAPSASAQSLNNKAPAPLQEGANQASVDSLIGPHYWYFFAEPGHFQLTFSKGGPNGPRLVRPRHHPGRLFSEDARCRHQRQVLARG